MDRILKKVLAFKNPMTRKKIPDFFAFLAGSVLALCLICGCEAAGADPAPELSPQKETPEKSVPDPAPVEKAAQKPAQGPGETESAVTVAPRNELSREALETYAYLLFIQAILDEDEAALLDVAPELAKSGAPQSIWLDGAVWLMSRKSPNSVVFLERALESMPNDLSLNLLYAESLGDHGMAARGVEAIRAFSARNPDALDAKLELALLLVKDRQFDAAREILGQITPKQRTPLVDYYQAKALMGMNMEAEAIPYLRKTVKGMPDFAEAIAELAFACEREGNYREARSLYERLKKLNFSPQEVALRLVNLSLKLKQPEKAVQYIKQGPDSIPFKLTGANMLLETRHYLQAENILKQIASQPDAPYEVYLLLADLSFEQRRNLNVAFNWLDKIDPKGPGASRAALLKIQLLNDAGKPAQALAEADKAIAAFPDAPEIWDMKIRLLARDKKTAQALAAARDAAAKWPDSTGLAFLLGSLLDEKGEKSEAMSVMEAILKKQPDNFQALNYVGFTLADENRDLARALELLTRADELSPNQSYIVDSLAWALFRAGKGEEALRQIRRAINLGEQPDAAIWDHYGDIARNQGKRDEARKAYRRAIELKPANVNEIRKKLSDV